MWIKSKFKKKPVPLNIIIVNGQRESKEIDLLYLVSIIIHIIDTKHIIDIIDIFSKWFWSCWLKDKTSQSALFCIKKYINAFGKINNLKTDSGT